MIFVDTNMFYNFLFETELSPRAKGIIEMPYELVTSFTVLDELVYVVIRKLAEKR
ncbi:PIN domain-containing protein [Pyrococcus kukulkanii]|uniref:PIN domain-containing protein n=1 Tax=Pyrococcus kukulkanii TaxID=1609559 RepID=UPI003567C49E